MEGGGCFDKDARYECGRGDGLFVFLVFVFVAVECVECVAGRVGLPRNC